MIREIDDNSCEIVRAATRSLDSNRPGKLAYNIVKEARSLGYILPLVGAEIYSKSLIEVYPHA